VIACMVVAGLQVLVGCEPSSDRLQVSGEITLDGFPLDDGAIRFTSQGGEKQFASGAMIEKGQYFIPQEKGLPPGKYRVEISAVDESVPPALYRAAPGEPAMLTQPERIPPEYNVESRHTVEVAADNENHFVFKIQSRAEQ